MRLATVGAAAVLAFALGTGAAFAAGTGGGNGGGTGGDGRGNHDQINSDRFDEPGSVDQCANVLANPREYTRDQIQQCKRLQH